MGRRFPVDENQEIHPMMSLSIMIACILATMAIVSSLCGEKEKEEDPEKKTKMESSEVVNPPNEFDMAGGDGEKAAGEEHLPLPPPPGRHSRSASYHMRSASSASLTGKLKSSMSMKLPGALKSAMSMKISGSGGKDNSNHSKADKKLKHEDSIWQKTIILGEKCKVPKEEDNDAILYDEKGNRITAYHTKAPTGKTLSRQASSMDQISTTEIKT